MKCASLQASHGNTIDTPEDAKKPCISQNLPPTMDEVNAIARDVCLSVCLLARLLKNACMYLYDILRVDS